MASPDIQGIPGWLSQKEADELWRLAKDKKVLEVGSFCGRSTVALGSSATAVHCVDPFDGRGTPSPHDTLSRFRDTLAAFGLQNRVTYSKTTIEEWAKIASARVFDLVFIDGAHRFVDVKSNLESLHRFSSEGGVVAFHDYTNAEYPGVRQAADSVFHRKPDRLVESLGVYLNDGPFPGRLLNIVTPTSRPHNLCRLSESIDWLRGDLPGWVVRWLVYFDRSIDYLHPVVGASVVGRQPLAGHYGNSGRNEALDNVRAGWIHFLDDDNDIHPKFALGLREAVLEWPDATAYLFDQYTASEELRLRANPTAGIGGIDTAQFVFRRSVIGTCRWPLEDRVADGIFYRDVAKFASPATARSGAVYYNKLST